MIGLANPAAQYSKHQADIDEAVLEVLKSGQYVSGKRVKQFESSFAELHGCQFGIGVASGTAALVASLRALRIGPGDSVLVPANTFIATAEAVILCGARVQFIDCEPDYYGLSVSDLEQKIDSSSRAVIAVHMFGQMCDISAVKAITNQYDLRLIEDCAQAHLASHQGIPAGSVGDVGCFSFYPGKNLGAAGEAGAVITNHSALSESVRSYIQHGALIRYQHRELGDNLRMDEIQAAILEIKLRTLAEENQRRNQIARQYTERFSDIGELQLPTVRPDSEPAWHLYVIRTAQRDSLLEYLNANHIGAGIHYPVPCHQQVATQGWSKGSIDCPIAESTANTMISLPVHAELSAAEVDYIADKVCLFFR